LKRAKAPVQDLNVFASARAIGHFGQERAEQGLFSTGRAAKIVGLPMRTLDYWARIGLATPSIETSGTGSARWYKNDDLLVLAAMAALQKDTTITVRRGLAQEIRGAVKSAEFVRYKFGGVVEIIVNLKLLREQIRTRTDSPEGVNPK
jgi:DNA-binding protein